MYFTAEVSSIISCKQSQKSTVIVVDMNNAVTSSSNLPLQRQTYNTTLVTPLTNTKTEQLIKQANH